MKLTEEQQQIVTDNHDLIYGYIHSRNLNVDDWYGLFAIELCKAVMMYDSARGGLSTLFYVMCNNRMTKEYRDAGRYKRDGGDMYSLEYVYDNGESADLTLEQMVEDIEVNVSDEVGADDILQEMLSGEHGEIIRLRYLGYTQEEIADEIGFSQGYISRILTSMRGEYFSDYKAKDGYCS